MLGRSVDGSITFYSWVITLILFILFTCLNRGWSNPSDRVRQVSWLVQILGEKKS